MNEWLKLLQGFEALAWAYLGCLGLVYGIALYRAIRHDESLLSGEQIIRRTMLQADLRAAVAGIGVCLLAFLTLAFSYLPLSAIARQILTPLPLIGILVEVVFLLRQLWINRQGIRRLVSDEIARLRDGNTPSP